MTNDNKNLCRECTELYRKGMPSIRIKTPVATGKSEKCAQCGKSRPVNGVLMEVSRR